jgi:hypothetical protein
MHSLFGKRGVMLAGLLALALAALTPTAASAKPEPGARGRGFRLFSKSLGALTVNRVYCGLATTGEVCVDSTNSSTIGGGYWPKGTADQYNFNSGLQLAGVIGGTKPANPWGGDTTGAFFFDPKGTTQHGQEVQPIYNSQNPDDVANWPAAARVPAGDATADLYDPLLQGRVNASQGDVWWLSWEGNPTQNAGRSHPLGVMVETRGMGWNFPTGNQDILYYVYTFYNITSTNPADYAAARLDMQPILLAQAQLFQSQNNAAFGITLPSGGYTISNLFAAFGRDDDVGNAGTNYSTVNLPFALGVTYDQAFGRPTGWTFDPSIFASPFFPGVGFTGAKYLKSPTGPGQIQLFSNTINGGAFGDARDTKQLYRYLSGTLSTAAGDAPCNKGNPAISRMCFVNTGTAADMRFFQSSTSLNLAPGQFGSIVVAYIYAAPVITASVVPSSALTQKPGDPQLLDPKSPAQATALATTGANQVDTMMGFRSWVDDNGDCATVLASSPVGCAQQDEFRVVPGSMLGKAKTAQAVFDNKFLLPFAPDSPEFFLVPGDNQVTVLWRPSASESTGDPFFQVASAALIAGTPNPLYDPNYRQFDVEGYRIYRGRVDAPNSLTLLAQFDYGDTFITDFAGQVNPVINCAPELGISASAAVCPFDNPFPVPGSSTQARTKADSTFLVGGIVQVALGQRATLATTPPTAIILSADTALTGGGANGPCAPSACPELKDTGVPFVYVDNTVRNNFRYFYSVTAFDVNSVQSGPTSLESPRLTKSATPVALASNYSNSVSVTNGVVGRGAALNPNAPVPTLDPVTGEFSGSFPPANGLAAQFVGQLPAAIFSTGGTVSLKLVGLGLGDARNGPSASYTFQATSSTGVVTPITLQIAQSLVAVDAPVTPSPPFPAATSDAALAARFGASSAALVSGQASMTLSGYEGAGGQTRGCLDGTIPKAKGGATDCSYQGARWFVGDNETKADPNGGNLDVDVGGTPADFNNAGALPNVTTIYEPHSYATTGAGYRAIEAVFGGAQRAADIRMYWGAGGKVDSVIDLTHDVVVPFMADSVGGGWGILNAAAGAAGGSADAAAGIVTFADFGCVEPLRTRLHQSTVDAGIACTAASRYLLSNTVIPGQVRFTPTTGAAAANNGFGLYLAGHVFLFELTGGAVPAAGTAWTMRGYLGFINGGKGAGGNEGPYVFTAPPKRNFTALGASATLNFDITNQVLAADRTDLSKVHTVPDPYYVTSEFEQTTDTKIIKFVNLPADAIIRIYSSSGVLVTLLEHHSSQFGGAEDWNVRNRNNQVVASGVYFYHIEAGDARRVGRFTIVNFAQ